MGIISTVRRGLKLELEGIRTHDVPWLRRLWLYRNGFMSSRDVLYELSDESVDEYLSDRQRLRTRSINNRHRDLLKNKLQFHLIFGESHPEHVPAVYGLTGSGRRLSRMPILPFESTADLFETLAGEKLVVKPKIGALGTDVHVLDHDGDSPVFDGESMSEAAFLDRLAGLPESILVEHVDQADYAATIYPGSANTIRCLTMIDPVTDDAFIAAAVHRFGSKTSRHVDNFSSGGMAAPVDIETGELGDVVASTKGGSTFSRETSHPDTGAQVTGIRVPEWETVRERLLEITREYADLLPYVGWDVVVTDDDGSFVLIEGNSSPDIDLLQTHQPLLADERVRRFYDHHGVL